MVRLDVAKGDPIQAKKLWQDCTYSEVAEAWQSIQAQKEGVGYKVKT